jgi:hypothetical protein
LLPITCVGQTSFPPSGSCRRPKSLAFAIGAVLFGLFAPQHAAVARSTVCTITVNSEDEKSTFQRHFPNHRFVELVERGRPDWLASACRARVACDVLIVSAHFDGDNSFFSDRLEVNESLTVNELERASCSNACPSLFDRLKEVYLFGCNTLDPDPQSGASAEILRSLLSEGHSLKEARQQLHELHGIRGESSRDRMRQIFKGVPVIYGFRSTAPLGPIAGETLSRYFRAAGVRGIGQGRPSARLVQAFAAHGLTSAAGAGEQGALAEARADMCQFADDRLSTATKLQFVHTLLKRHIGEVRLQLDRVQRLTATLDAATRRSAGVGEALDQIRHDAATRERWLDYAHGTDPPVRVRMLRIARDVGWLSEREYLDELASMLRQVHSRRDVGISAVDLACTLNPDGRLDGIVDRSSAPIGATNGVAHAAFRACLGSADDRNRTLRALVESSDANLRTAQVYVRHRPLTTTIELRGMVNAISAMPPGPPQVRALETLARHYVADGEVLHGLLNLFAATPSAEVQAAIAGVLIRADRRALEERELISVLSQSRHPAPHGRHGLVDALIRTVQAH